MRSDELQELVEQLRKRGTDNQQVEVKAAFSGLPKGIVESVSAFANGSGGTIILGLDENAGFITSDQFRHAKISDALAEVLSNKLTPSVRPATLETLPFEDGWVVVAEVLPAEPHEKPVFVTTKGRYQGSFIRTNDGDHRLSNYEIDRMLEQVHQPRWDRELVSEATLDDLDAKLLESLIAREREARPRLLGKTPKEKLLQRLNIAHADESQRLRPTLAALLALGEYPQQFFPQLSVVFTHYKGVTKASDESGVRYLNSLVLEGPIPAMVFDVVETVKKSSPRGAIIKDSLRHDLFDFPPAAVREAVTNALLHRDYSPGARGTQVQVNLYLDRLEVLNPGGLYGPVTVESLGQDGQSSSRNEVLARLLESTPYEEGGFVAENRGSGYQEILDKLQQELLPPPAPHSNLNGFRLEFFKRKPTPAEQASREGGSTRKVVLDYLAQHSSASSRDLAAAAGVVLATVRRTVNILIDEGIVERTEPNRSPKQRYRLVRAERS